MAVMFSFLVGTHTSPTKHNKNICIDRQDGWTGIPATQSAAGVSAYVRLTQAVSQCADSRCEYHLQAVRRASTRTGVSDRSIRSACCKAWRPRACWGWR